MMILSHFLFFTLNQCNLLFEMNMLCHNGHLCSIYKLTSSGCRECLQKTKHSPAYEEEEKEKEKEEESCHYCHASGPIINKYGNIRSCAKCLAKIYAHMTNFYNSVGGNMSLLIKKGVESFEQSLRGIQPKNTYKEKEDESCHYCHASGPIINKYGNIRSCAKCLAGIDEHMSEFYISAGGDMSLLIKKGVESFEQSLHV